MVNPLIARAIFLVISAATGASALHLAACSPVERQHNVDDQLLTLVYGSTISEAALQELRQMLKPLNDAGAEDQVVSVTLNHGGPWDVRDRQTLQGKAVITDYQIWINDKHPKAERLSRKFIAGGAWQVRLISAAIENWSQHADIASRTAGTSARVHVTAQTGFFGEEWIAIFAIDEILEGAVPNRPQPAHLPDSATLEVVVRMIDHRLLGDDDAE